jgi:hypothetical protein
MAKQLGVKFPDAADVPETQGEAVMLNLLPETLGSDLKEAL